MSFSAAIRRGAESRDWSCTRTTNQRRRRLGESLEAVLCSSRRRSVGNLMAGWTAGPFGDNNIPQIHIVLGGEPDVLFMNPFAPSGCRNKRQNIDIGQHYIREGERMTLVLGGEGQPRDWVAGEQQRPG